MKVAFHSSIEDTTALHEALLQRQRANGQATKPIKQLLSLSAWMAVLIAVVWFLLKSPPYALMSVLGLFVLIFGFSHKSFYRKSLRKYFEKSHGADAWLPCVVEISDDGLSVVTRDNITAFWWPQISEILQEGAYLRFYTHISSVAQVPLRVFRTPDDLARFEGEARALWQEHRNDPPAAFPEISGIIEDEVNVPGCVLINPTQLDPPSDTPPGPGVRGCRGHRRRSRGGPRFPGPTPCARR